MTPEQASAAGPVVPEPVQYTRKAARLPPATLQTNVAAYVTSYERGCRRVWPVGGAFRRL